MHTSTKEKASNIIKMFLIQCMATVTSSRLSL